jgi:hypothetical protein
LNIVSGIRYPAGVDDYSHERCLPSAERTRS